jgi:hypothetical protein
VEEVGLGRKRLVAAAIFLLALVATIIYATTRREEYAPEQPIAYSHKTHVTGKKIECAFCHENGEGRSPHMLIPSAEKCALCHRAVKRDHPEVQKILKHAEAKTEPEWKRVHGFAAEANVFFTHVPHLRAKISCQTCHGDVGQMERVTRVFDQTMGWCLKCHEQTPNQLVAIPNTKVEVNRLMDCSVCHR